MILEHDDDYTGVLRDFCNLIAQVKKTMGVSGTLVMDTSYLEEAGPLDPAEFDFPSKMSVKFVLGSAECTVLHYSVTLYVP